MENKVLYGIEQIDVNEKAKKAYAIANNAIYFDDNSDYLTALFEICRALKPDINEEEIGKTYMDEDL